MYASPFEIRAASRLHFGLLSFGWPETVRQHGGVGMMIDGPGTLLRGDHAVSFASSGPGSERVQEFAAHWSRYHDRELPHCHLEVRQLAPQHMGLGTGTQLGLSVAAALDYASGRRVDEKAVAAPAQLAASVGRCGRSSVGTYGFVHGGLIYERGKTAEEPIGELAARTELPAEWRVVLILPQLAAGLSGQAEKQAFGGLPPVAPNVTDRLTEEVEQRMLPAAAAGDLLEFGESVYRYGYTAGMCFASRQGGPFAHPLLEDWVKAIRKRGISGVGQSSWGPLIFALVDSDQAADELAAWFRREICSPAVPVELCTSRLAARGTEVTRTAQGAE